MPLRRTVSSFLAIAVLLLPAVPGKAEEPGADRAANGFVIESVTLEEADDDRDSLLEGLQASLDRARANGRLTGRRSAPTLSLEQALRLAEWRRGVVQQLEQSVR